MRKRFSWLLTLAMTASLLTPAAVGAAESDEAYVYAEEISDDTYADEDFYEDDQDEYPEDEASEEVSDEENSDEEELSPSEEAEEIHLRDDTESAEEDAEWGEYESDDAAEAGEIIDSGNYGENLTWTLDSEGVLTIAGEGKMKDYSFDDQETRPWYSKREKITGVKIEEGVTSIGGYAFYECDKMEKVEIAGTVKQIEDYSFQSCRNLKSVDIPKSVTSIGRAAFWGCDSLNSVIIPESVNNIGVGAFFRLFQLEQCGYPGRRYKPQ